MTSPLSRKDGQLISLGARVSYPLPSTLFGAEAKAHLKYSTLSPSSLFPSPPFHFPLDHKLKLWRKHLIHTRHTCPTKYRLMHKISSYICITLSRMVILSHMCRWIIELSN